VFRGRAARDIPPTAVPRAEPPDARPPRRARRASEPV